MTEKIFVTNKEGKRHVGQTDVLFITATAVETAAIQNEMDPAPSSRGLISFPHKHQTYVVGCIGNYRVSHVQCNMGSGQPGASLLTATDAIKLWRPKAIIMIGICFAISRKLRIGDVLVAEQLLLYDLKREGVETKIHRGARPFAGSVLRNRFKSADSWSFELSEGKSAKAIPCDLLSGESLIDNSGFLKSLATSFPTAKGGEMEGAGLYAAAEREGLEWIVVKGVCDYADGRKGYQKEKRQKLAAASAASFCKHVLKLPDSLRDINCRPVPAKQVIPSSAHATVADPTDAVLFDIYSKELEKYYHVRDVDDDIKRLLDSGGVWVSGPSGVGKTNTLIRALMRSEREYLFVDLSPTLGQSLESMFWTLLADITQRFQRPFQNRSPERMQMNDIITEIVKALLDSQADCSIVVDEIPLDKQDFPRFFKTAHAILTMLSNKIPRGRIRFAFSTLYSAPNTGIVTNKAAALLPCYELKPWKRTELTRLMSLINKRLKLPMPKEIKNLVILASKDSPRVLKSIFRTRLTFLNNERWSWDKVISHTQIH